MGKKLSPKLTVRDWIRTVEVETNGHRESWKPFSNEPIRGDARDCGRDAARLFHLPKHLLDRDRSGPDPMTNVITMVFTASETTWYVTYRPGLAYKRSDAGKKIPLGDIPTR